MKKKLCINLRYSPKLSLYSHYFNLKTYYRVVKAFLFVCHSWVHENFLGDRKKIWQAKKVLNYHNHCFVSSSEQQKVFLELPQERSFISFDEQTWRCSAINIHDYFSSYDLASKKSRLQLPKLKIAATASFN